MKVDGNLWVYQMHFPPQASRGACEQIAEMTKPVEAEEEGQEDETKPYTVEVGEEEIATHKKKIQPISTVGNGTSGR